MKKVFSLMIIAVLSLTAILPVFSQKIKSDRTQKVSTEKNPPQTDFKLSNAQAFSDGNGVFLQWQAEAENRNLGFFVYRVTEKGTELVSQSIVPSKSLHTRETLYGEKYSYFDRKGNFSTSYYIETINLNGQRQTSELLVPQYTDDLTGVAGFSSEQLIKEDEAAKPPNESNLLNLPKDLQKDNEANFLPPNINRQRFIASQPGVKISVSKEGIYRVSRTELQNAGFNVSTAGNFWQLSLDGNEQSINIGANDSYIEFYGKGIDTPESATKVYYLTVGSQNGKRIGINTLRTIVGNVVGQSYDQTYVRKDRESYIDFGILNGDAENFFGSVPIIGSSTPNPPAATFTFNLTGIDFSIRKFSFDLGIQGITSSSHQLVPVLNGNTLETITGSGLNLMNGSLRIPTAYLREGVNTLELKTFGGGGDIDLIESIKVGYLRKYEAIQNNLSFYTANYRTSTLSNFSSPNIRVFDLSYPDSPTRIANLRINNNSGNYSVTLPAHRGRAMFAVEDSAILTADSIIQNTPSTLSTAAHNGGMIIVTYKDWMTQANDWANYRRGQGMTVEIVDIDDIFDEFSYGTVSTAGMSSFFNYAKNNWQTPPIYILLIGDASYDYRNYENRPFQNFIPTKRVDTVYEETGSDEAFCDFSNTGLSEIAIGRIPARTPQDVTLMLNKTMTFESTIANGFNRGALFASDLPNGYDFDGLSRRVAEQLPASMPKTFINRGDANSHNVLISNLNTGKYIVNYSGHGSTGAWQSNFIGPNDPVTLTNTPNYTVFTLLTCLNGYFLRADADSLSERLIKAPNGGAVSVWASSGETTPDVQEVMATRFYNQLNVGNMNRIGDLIKDAKANLIGGRDVRLSWVLIGDPAMRMK
jgi:Peptidase family C25